MSTILFDQIAFGPIKSRRLGISLGMNLLPYDGKLCSFDCIYCECGYNKDNKTTTALPSREDIKKALENKLIALSIENIIPDVITFAGNGEPTIHPLFSEIIDDTIELRNKYVPKAKISVLSNGMHIDKENVFNALKKIDNNILKLDSAIESTAKLIDKPNSPNYNIKRQIELFKKFEGKFIMQTMFVKGAHNSIELDNTTDEEVSAWLEAVRETNPEEVMIYTIDRETPEKSLEKISIDTLLNIAEKVKQMNIKVNVAG